MKYGWNPIDRHGRLQQHVAHARAQRGGARRHVSDSVGVLELEAHDQQPTPNAAPRTGRLLGDVAVPMKPVRSAAAGAAVSARTTRAVSALGWIAIPG